MSTVALNAVGAEAADCGTMIVEVAVPNEFTPPTAVIGVTLTETGSKRFGRPADTGIYKGLYKGCDVAIRTPLWNFMSAKVSQQGLIEELVKRTPHKTEYPDRTEPDRAIPDVRKRAKSALHGVGGVQDQH